MFSVLQQENEENIMDYVRKERFDVVIADMIRTAPYIRAFEKEPCLKILDMDDLLSKRYQRTLNSTVSGDNFWDSTASTCRIL